MEDLNDAAMKIVAQIPYNVPITRTQLVCWSGMSDRSVRDCISQARKHGYIIISAMHGAGYYRTSDPEDILGFYRREKARARSIGISLNAARKWLKERNIEC
jgi:hypothetical protein